MQEPDTCVSAVALQPTHPPHTNIIASVSSDVSDEQQQQQQAEETAAATPSTSSQQQQQQQVQEKPQGRVIASSLFRGSRGVRRRI